MQRACAVARLLRFMKATSLYKSPPIEIYLELAQIALRNGHGEAAIEHAMEVCGFRAPHPPWVFAAACMCARRRRPGRCESTRPRQCDLHVGMHARPPCRTHIDQVPCRSFDGMRVRVCASAAGGGRGTYRVWVWVLCALSRRGWNTSPRTASSCGCLARRLSERARRTSHRESLRLIRQMPFTLPRARAPSTPS